MRILSCIAVAVALASFCVICAMQSVSVFADSGGGGEPGIDYPFTTSSKVCIEAERRDPPNWPTDESDCVSHALLMECIPAELTTCAGHENGYWDSLYCQGTDVLDIQPGGSVAVSLSPTETPSPGHTVRRRCLRDRAW